VEILVLHVPVADRAPRRGPLVAVERLQAPERLANLRGLQADERIGVAIGARDRLGLELFERAPLRVFSPRRPGKREQGQESEKGFQVQRP
jgi:hypothetical protein